MIRHHTLALSLLALTACDQPTINLAIALPPGIKIHATIYDSVTNHEPGQAKIRGKLLIENQTNQAYAHLNRRLWLSIENHGSRRTYVEGVASHVADSSGISIEPGENLELGVYWVFPDTVVTLSEQNLSLDFAIP